MSMPGMSRRGEPAELVPPPLKFLPTDTALLLSEGNPFLWRWNGEKWIVDTELYEAIMMMQIVRPGELAVIVSLSARKGCSSGRQNWLVGQGS